MHTIKVAPLADGWRVCADTVANDMVFRSGRAAELAARALAARLSRAGMPTEVHIHLRDHTLGARFSLGPGQMSPRELEAA
jgi:hypothetical protein